MTDEDYDKLYQAHLASLKRDMGATMADAMHRALDKMAENERELGIQMTPQPLALRLADALEVRGFLGTTAHEAAAELRRLHEAYECNTAIMHARTKRMNELHALNKELLEALKVVIDDLMYKDHARVINVAHAAIAKAEGNHE